MAVASIDDQGRIYLPKDIRERYGGKFRIIDTKNGVMFQPLPEDPLEEFQEKEKLSGKTVEELKEEVRDESRKQATE